MYVLVSDSKQRGNNNLTVINIYGFGGSSQKLGIDIKMKRVVLRCIVKLPMHRQTGWHDRDRSRFKRLLKALITDAPRSPNAISYFNAKPVLFPPPRYPFLY